MQQASAPSRSVSPTPKRRLPLRTLWFMFLLMLLGLAGVAGVTRLTLNSAAETIQADLYRSLAGQAQTKVAQLTIWFGALSDQTARLANSDPVRLFASEADEHNYDTAELLRFSRIEGEDEGFAARPDAERLHGLDQLGAQAPLMRRQLEEFVHSHFMSAATLFNSQGAPYLTTMANTPEYPEHVLTELRVVMKSGKMQTLPAHRDASDRLIMDMLLPIFAPLYVDDSGKKVVGGLVMSVDISFRVRNLTHLADETDSMVESGRILQLAGKSIQELPADGSPIRTLPGWEIASPGEPLALGRRTHAEGEAPVYSLALPVPEMPLLVEQEIPVKNANLQYEAFRKSVLLSAALIAVVAALLLVMLWWWLVGRSERSIAAELRELYDTVTRQNQIIESVNTTIEDGIVLSNNHGRFIYTNQAFADMAGETPVTLTERTCTTLANLAVGSNIRAHTEAVHQADAPLTFMDTLYIHAVMRSYQVACAPFRDDRGSILGVVSVYRDITELLTAQERAQHMVNQTVHVFVRAIEAVDPYLRGQSSRTGLLAMSLAHHLGLESHDATLRTAANLSQIGMIQLPHSLLAKTGKLTPEERTQLEKHVEYARNALEDIDFGYPVLEAITQMHERLDGSGYPQQLTGDAIGIDGRILAVASTFCAVLRPRSYREARTQEDALEILSATPYQYDPKVVQALHAYLETVEGQEFQRELSQED